jgi:hypothetical protein
MPLSTAEGAGGGIGCGGAVIPKEARSSMPLSTEEEEEAAGAGSGREGCGGAIPKEERSIVPVSTDEGARRCCC